MSRAASATCWWTAAPVWSACASNCPGSPNDRCWRWPATPTSTISPATTTAERLAHPAEAEILAAPDGDNTLARAYVGDEMFEAHPECPLCYAEYRVRAAPATRLIDEGDVLDLGDRVLQVLHTPGHSPGGISLWEAATQTLFSGDIVYDGPLVEDAYHSNLDDYASSLAPARATGAHRAWRAFRELFRGAFEGNDRRLVQEPRSIDQNRDLASAAGGGQSVGEPAQRRCRAARRRRCSSFSTGMGCMRGASIRPRATPSCHARFCSQSFMTGPLSKETGRPDKSGRPRKE